MPLDLKAAIYGAYWTLAIKAGQSAYNAVANGAGLSLLQDADLYDMRTPNARAILRDMATIPSGGGFPKVLVRHVSTTGPQVATKTFGYAAGASCDVAMPGDGHVGAGNRPRFDQRLGCRPDAAGGRTWTRQSWPRPGRSSA